MPDLTASRRTLLTGAVATAITAAVVPWNDAAAARHSRVPNWRRNRELRPTRDHRDGVKRLALPNGFQYRTFHHAGDQLDDGTTIPGFHDGMGAFAGSRPNTTILVRNHEVGGTPGAFGPVEVAYDPVGGGGTITIEVDRHGKVISDRVSLNGTSVNCNGGPTPWRTWLSGEETVQGPDVPLPGGAAGGTRPHGYIFEVPVDGASDRRPIRSAGRFAHEAAVVDPSTGFVYLTEDSLAAGFYRYRAPADPFQAGRLLDGGQLEALAIVGQPGADLSGHFANGTTFETTWVPIAEPDPTFAPGTTFDAATAAVSQQGALVGAAKFFFLEGAAWGNGKVWFVSTGGGTPADPYPVGRGQIWVYEPATARLEMFYESPDVDVMFLPDNIAIAPSGALVVCEDGLAPNHLLAVSLDGEVSPLASIEAPANASDEWAGPSFSRDGHTLFVNVLGPAGFSAAIWGPWRQSGVG